MEFTLWLDALSGQWPLVLACTGAAALLAGALGLVTRALGQKEGDGLKRSKGRRAKKE